MFMGGNSSLVVRHAPLKQALAFNGSVEIAELIESL